MDARRSPIGRARGYGSTKEGTTHWWAQRLTALALVPLAVWFSISVVSLTGAPQPEVAEWLASGRTAVMMSLLVVATFYHLKLGLQVVAEDYVHHETIKLVSLMLINFTCIVLTFICIISILKLAIPG